MILAEQTSFAGSKIILRKGDESCHQLLHPVAPASRNGEISPALLSGKARIGIDLVAHRPHRRGPFVWALLVLRIDHPQHDVSLGRARPRPTDALLPHG